MAKLKKKYHTFRRKDPDDPDGEPLELKCLVVPHKKGAKPISLPLLTKHIEEAIRRDGQADGQNCGGGVCLQKNKHLFPHPIKALVDWWPNQVFVYAGYRKDGMPICYEYAHYDNTAELFDGTDSDLHKLLRQIQRSGGEREIKLYPAVRGRHYRTKKPSRPPGPSGKSGKARKPRVSGDMLRLINHRSARADMVRQQNQEELS